MGSILMLSAIFAPLAGAAILPYAGRVSERLRNILALVLALTSLAASASLLAMISANGAVLFKLNLPLGFNMGFKADGLAVFMAVVSSLVSAIIVLYSFGYINHYRNRNEYYAMVILFLGAMMGLVYSSNLIFLYIFWEITAITSWRLIGFFRGDEHVYKANKSFLVTVFGSLLMLIGFVMLFAQTGSFDLFVIREAFWGMPIPNAAAILILAGIISKSATLPLHTWLPDAGVAPSPVTALLHAAVLVKIGVYVYARLFIATFGAAESVRMGLIALAGASALVSAGCALVETDIKRIIAYSTVSQIAFIFLGFALGTGIGVAGALLYILMHGLAKGGLFLCAGIVEQGAGTKDIRRMGGFFHTMPVTGTAFFVCALSVMGVPPLGGFFSKFMVFSAAADGRHNTAIFVFLIGAFLTIAYLLRLFNLVFMGAGGAQTPKEGSSTMLFSVALLAILSIAAGIMINYPSHLAYNIARHLTGI